MHEMIKRRALFFTPILDAILYLGSTFLHQEFFCDACASDRTNFLNFGLRHKKQANYQGIISVALTPFVQHAKLISASLRQIIDGVVERNKRRVVKK